MDAETAEPGSPQDADIVRHYRAGTLLQELTRPRDADQRKALHAQMADLHNAGDIDLVALTGTAEFERLDRRYHFAIQQAYGDAMPLLTVGTQSMLEIVRRMEAQAGSIAAPPRIALRKWLGSAPDRAAEVVRMAEADPGFDPDILMDALVVLADEVAATTFLVVADSRRRAALAALGTIKPKNLKSAQTTFRRLMEFAAPRIDEGTRYTAISSAFDLSRHYKGRSSKWIAGLVAVVKEDPSENARAALLNGLRQRPDLLRKEDVSLVLDAAIDGDLSQPRLFDALVGTLYQLVGGPHHEAAIDCLTTCVASTGKSLPFEKFELLEHRLAELDRTLLFALAIRWFGTGDHLLCQIVSKLVGKAHDQRPFDASLAAFALTSGQIVALCHKAIGFMPLAPIVAASFVVAALRAGDKAAEPELIQLLFQTLLINFRETVATYLKRIGKGDAAYKPVRAALKKYRSYAGDCRIVTPLKELHPSTYQRGVARDAHYLASREIRKQAERQSVFANLVHKSVLLYGRKAIIYSRGADAPPTSMEMRPFSAHIEMPRLQTIDPVGVELLFSIFRISRPR